MKYLSNNKIYLKPLVDFINKENLLSEKNNILINLFINKELLNDDFCYLIKYFNK